jgi:ABC-2 type transport system permease protein
MIVSSGQPTRLLRAPGFGPLFARAGRGDYLESITPGIMAMGVIFTSVFGGIEIIWDRQFGCLTETLVAPVPRLAIVRGYALGAAIAASLQKCRGSIICLLAGCRIRHPLLLPLCGRRSVLFARIAP